MVVAQYNPVKILPLFKCEVCTFMTRTQEILKDHTAKKHRKFKQEVVTIQEQLEYMISCISCLFKPKDYEDLKNHVNKKHNTFLNVHPDTVQDIHCEECDNVFQNAGALENHKEHTHADITKHVIQIIDDKCSKCGKS